MNNEIDPNTLVGKTIKSIDTGAVNAWHITFTDGTTVTISGEISRFNFPTLSLEEGWEY
jgi:molybdopterin-binding protein